jgi:hypothetical protein
VVNTAAIETDHLQTSVSTAAVRTFELTRELLQEAARTLPETGGALELREAINETSARMAATDASIAGLVEIVLTARQVAQVCDLLATRHRRTSPTALACARLATSSADLAIEALTEDLAWTHVALLSRRACQMIEIQQLRDQASRTAGTLERHRAELSAASGGV